MLHVFSNNPVSKCALSSVLSLPVSTSRSLQVLDINPLIILFNYCVELLFKILKLKPSFRIRACRNFVCFPACFCSPASCFAAFVRHKYSTVLVYFWLFSPSILSPLHLTWTVGSSNCVWGKQLLMLDLRSDPDFPSLCRHHVLLAEITRNVWFFQYKLFKLLFYSCLLVF